MNDNCKILSLFKMNNEVKEFNKIINMNEYNLLVNNTSTYHNYLLSSVLFQNTNNSIIYIASNLYKAIHAYENLVEILGLENVNFYATDEIIATELLATSSDFKLERLHTIRNIVNNKKTIIVTNVISLTQEIMPLKDIKKNILHFRINEIIDINEIVKSLIKIGYKKQAITEKVGDFSVRGEVLDIFCVNMNKPVRIDLFDNEIDIIKTFDNLTQKTIEKIDSFDVFPINEILYDDPNEIIKKIKLKENKELNDFDDILNYNNLSRLHKYLHYITDEKVTLFDYLDNKTIIYDEIKRIEESYEKQVYELQNFISTQPKTNLDLSFLTDYHVIFPKEANKIYLTQFRQSINNIKIDNILDLKGIDVINYQNDIKSFILDINLNRKTYVITFTNNNLKTLFIESLIANNIKYNLIEDVKDIKMKELNIISDNNHISFAFINGLEVISEQNLYKKIIKGKSKYRSQYQNTVPITSKEDLKPGEFVVHYNYGIGKYLGIKTIELNNIKNDYLIIAFSNMELFIPVDNINLIDKYQGSEGSVPRLNAIGNNDWEKKKAKIKEKLENIAKDLIKVQAIREEKKGYKYVRDEELESAFENDFEYVETHDQQKAIDDIKLDMEEGKIVDRLVCGDAGYGKTEIAMRIAFETIVNGKQVAYLAPTTILTRQHFYTFKDRLEKYGVKVALLNRFVSAKDQSNIIKGLKNGEVDIVIGTHVLLNEKIEYKDLGLLIVDEEQRFGVTHKEKIKQYKNNVNVLTLTATPIPRTLQMSIMGVRQLSLIETPPQNRYPVQTYVLEENDSIIREAIYLEISRGGQVFYLHNRVFDLERVYRKLRKLVPEAKIVMAHGQMDKNLLEDTIQSFIDKEFDVLLCTTIIETGIDIPNSNTLIVDMADRLGLAQMYQIRGRVGRSDRVSYAYFMYEEKKVLTDSGAKRLNAIKEFTTLGSGYKIAVRDLAIRGAGDILGKEQSGFIDSIGLELYMKMLNEAIEDVKGIRKKENKKRAWNIEVSKHVSNNYVSDDDIKIYIHKMISQIKSKEDKEKLLIELKDRFGRISDEIITYINKQYMDGLFEEMDIEKIDEKDNFVIFCFSENKTNKLDGKLLLQKVNEVSTRITLEYKERKIFVKVPKIKANKDWIVQVISLLEKLF